jgi:hypothetical protein
MQIAGSAGSIQGGAGNPNREWESSCYLNFYQIFMLVFSFCLYFVLIIKYDHLKTKLKFNRIFVNVLCFKALNEQTIQLVTSNNKSNNTLVLNGPIKMDERI